MPTTKTTITITDLQNAAGTLLGNAHLTIRLNAGVNGGVVDGAVIAATAHIQTSAGGDASIQLYPNSAITPANSYYTISVDETSPLIYRTISVPSGGGTYDWSAAGIQVTPVDVAGPVPAASSGTAGQVVRVDSGGTTYTLGNHNDIAGRSTASAHPDTAISTTTGSAGLFKSASTVAEWETAADTYGVSAGTKAEVSSELPAIVADAGTTQEQINDNAARVVGVALATAYKARDIGDIVGAGPLEGSGLYNGLDTLVAQSTQTEGILDRWMFAAAVEDVANINLTPLLAGPVATQPTFAHGSLSGISSGQRPHAHVLLLAQSTASQNRIYQVDKTTGQWSLPGDTDVFWPPGNGYRATLKAPGDADHGMTWIWTFDDKTVVQRGGNYSDAALTNTDGRWTLWTDPTGSGGGLSLGSTSTTAYRGDRGTTAYDHSQITTGNPHGTTVTDLGAVPTSRTLAGLDLTANRTAAALRSALGFTSVVLASDVPSNVSGSGTTPVNITTHSVSYVNGDKLFISAEEFYTGDAAGDIRIGATFTNATVLLDVEGVSQAASSFPASRAVQGSITSTAGYVELGCQTGGTQRASVRGSLIATGTGTLQLTVAQRSGNATATTIKTGSTFRAEASS